MTPREWAQTFFDRLEQQGPPPLARQKWDAPRKIAAELFADAIREAYEDAAEIAEGMCITATATKSFAIREYEGDVAAAIRDAEIAAPAPPSSPGGDRQMTPLGYLKDKWAYTEGYRAAIEDAAKIAEGMCITATATKSFAIREYEGDVAARIRSRSQGE